MSLPKRSILSPLIPGSRTPEEFRAAVEEVVDRRRRFHEVSTPESSTLKAGYSSEAADEEGERQAPDDLCKSDPSSR